MDSILIRLTWSEKNAFVFLDHWPRELRHSVLRKQCKYTNTSKFALQLHDSGVKSWINTWLKFSSAPVYSCLIIVWSYVLTSFMWPFWCLSNLAIALCVLMCYHRKPNRSLDFKSSHTQISLPSWHESTWKHGMYRNNSFNMLHHVNIKVSSK